MNRARKALDECSERLDTAEEERKKFEAWTRSNPLSENPLDRDGFGYRYTAIDFAWIVWRAAKGIM